MNTIVIQGDDKFPEVQARQAAPSPDGPLAVVRDLVGRLHAAQLRYCHWKSNEHVGAAVQGHTDLDVLVEPGRSDDLQRILAESGFRRFQATAVTAYPAVEDYLGFDAATTRIVHLHLHHRLTLGQKHLKGYRLPWEEMVLASRKLDVQHGLYVVAPEMELLLLLVRDALKRRLRSRLAIWLGRTRAKGDFAREFAWLVERTTGDAVVALAIPLFGVQAEAPLRRILENGARPQDLASFAAVARPALERYRTYGRLSAALLMPARELLWALGGLSRRRFHWSVPLRRVSPRGGVIVAFLGSDGAGKSTQCASTVAWLGEKLDVVPVYFGSGDGPSSLLRMPLQFARRLVDSRTPSASPSERRAGKRGRLRSAALIFWALSLSLEKRGKLRRMIRARNRGLIVICDRFSQNQIEGFNDGRLLGELAQSRWRLARALAAWEAKPYEDSLLDPPDLVIKLVASTNVAMFRRPEMTAEDIDRRIAAVRALRFPDQTRDVEVGADQPIDAVSHSVRRLIWEVL